MFSVVWTLDTCIHLSLPHPKPQIYSTTTHELEHSPHDTAYYRNSSASDVNQINTQYKLAGGAFLGMIIPWMFSYAVANDPGSRRLVAKLSPGLGELWSLFSLRPLVMLLLLLAFGLWWAWPCSRLGVAGGSVVAARRVSLPATTTWRRFCRAIVPKLLCL